MSKIDLFEREFRSRLAETQNSNKERDEFSKDQLEQATAVSLELLLRARAVLQESAGSNGSIEIEDVRVDKQGNASQRVTIAIGIRSPINLVFEKNVAYDTVEVHGLDSVAVDYAAQHAEFGTPPVIERERVRMSERFIAIDPTDGAALGQTIGRMLYRLADR